MLKKIYYLILLFIFFNLNFDSTFAKNFYFPQSNSSCEELYKSNWQFLTIPHPEWYPILDSELYSKCSFANFAYDDSISSYLKPSFRKSLYGSSAYWARFYTSLSLQGDSITPSYSPTYYFIKLKEQGWKYWKATINFSNLWFDYWLDSFPVYYQVDFLNDKWDIINQDEPINLLENMTSDYPVYRIDWFANWNQESNKKPIYYGFWLKPSQSTNYSDYWKDNRLFVRQSAWEVFHNKLNIDLDSQLAKYCQSDSNCYSSLKYIKLTVWIYQDKWTCQVSANIPMKWVSAPFKLEDCYGKGYSNKYSFWKINWGIISFELGAFQSIEGYWEQNPSIILWASSIYDEKKRNVLETNSYCQTWNWFKFDSTKIKKPWVDLDWNPIMIDTLDEVCPNPYDETTDFSSFFNDFKNKLSNSWFVKIWSSLASDKFFWSYLMDQIRWNQFNWQWFYPTRDPEMGYKTNEWSTVSARYWSRISYDVTFKVWQKSMDILTYDWDNKWTPKTDATLTIWFYKPVQSNSKTTNIISDVIQIKNPWTSSLNIDTTLWTINWWTVESFDFEGSWYNKSIVIPWPSWNKNTSIHTIWFSDLLYLANSESSSNKINDLKFLSDYIDFQWRLIKDITVQFTIRNYNYSPSENNTPKDNQLYISTNWFSWKADDVEIEKEFYPLSTKLLNYRYSVYDVLGSYLNWSADVSLTKDNVPSYTGNSSDSWAIQSYKERNSNYLVYSVINESKQLKWVIAEWSYWVDYFNPELLIYYDNNIDWGKFSDTEFNVVKSSQYGSWNYMLWNSESSSSAYAWSKQTAQDREMNKFTMNDENYTKYCEHYEASLSGGYDVVNYSPNSKPYKKPDQVICYYTKNNWTEKYIWNNSLINSSALASIRNNADYALIYLKYSHSITPSSESKYYQPLNILMSKSLTNENFLSPDTKQDLTDAQDEIKNNTNDNKRFKLINSVQTWNKIIEEQEKWNLSEEEKEAIAKSFHNFSYVIRTDVKRYFAPNTNVVNSTYRNDLFLSDWRKWVNDASDGYFADENNELKKSWSWYWTFIWSTSVKTRKPEIFVDYCYDKTSPKWIWIPNAWESKRWKDTNWNNVISSVWLNELYNVYPYVQNVWDKDICDVSFKLKDVQNVTQSTTYNSNDSLQLTNSNLVLKKLSSWESWWNITCNHPNDMLPLNPEDYVVYTWDNWNLVEQVMMKEKRTIDWKDYFVPSYYKTDIWTNNIPLAYKDLFIPWPSFANKLVFSAEWYECWRVDDPIKPSEDAELNIKVTNNNSVTLNNSCYVEIESTPENGNTVYPNSEIFYKLKVKNIQVPDSTNSKIYNVEVKLKTPNNSTRISWLSDNWTQVAYSLWQGEEVSYSLWTNDNLFKQIVVSSNGAPWTSILAEAQCRYTKEPETPSCTQQEKNGTYSDSSYAILCKGLPWDVVKHVVGNIDWDVVTSKILTWPCYWAKKTDGTDDFSYPKVDSSANACPVKTSNNTSNTIDFTKQNELESLACLVVNYYRKWKDINAQSFIRQRMWGSFQNYWMYNSFLSWSNGWQIWYNRNSSSSYVLDISSSYSNWIVWWNWHYPSWSYREGSVRWQYNEVFLNYEIDLPADYLSHYWMTNVTNYYWKSWNELNFSNPIQWIVAKSNYFSDGVSVDVVNVQVNWNKLLVRVKLRTNHNNPNLWYVDSNDLSNPFQIALESWRTDISEWNEIVQLRITLRTKNAWIDAEDNGSMTDSLWNSKIRNTNIKIKANISYTKNLFNIVSTWYNSSDTRCSRWDCRSWPTRLRTWNIVNTESNLWPYYFESKEVNQSIWICDSAPWIQVLWGWTYGNDYQFWNLNQLYDPTNLGSYNYNWFIWGWNSWLKNNSNRNVSWFISKENDTWNKDKIGQDLKFVFPEMNLCFNSESNSYNACKPWEISWYDALKKWYFWKLTVLNNTDLDNFYNNWNWTLDLGWKIYYYNANVSQNSLNDWTLTASWWTMVLWNKNSNTITIKGQWLIFVEWNLNIESDIVYENNRLDLNSYSYEEAVKRLSWVWFIVTWNIYISWKVQNVNWLFFSNNMIYTWENTNWLTLFGWYFAKKFKLERLYNTINKIDPISWKSVPSERFIWDGRYDVLSIPWFKQLNWFDSRRIVPAWEN